MGNDNKSDTKPVRPIGPPNRPQGDTKPVRRVTEPPHTIPSSSPSPVQPTYRQPPPTPPPTRTRPPYPPQTTLPRQPIRPTDNRWRWATRTVIILAVGLITITALALAGGVITYFTIAAQLPPADELRARSLRFATTQILDRQGRLLWEIIDPTGGRRTTVTLNNISPDLIRATIATEDRYFYVNVGVDPIAITRALYYNLSEGEIVSGASTITQQLARNVLLTPQERAEQSLARKVKEAVLAVEINRRYTKDQILEIYLNQIYYGNMAYGIEAASQTYFGKSARDLTLPEAAMLAGLPQAAALHDPYTNPADAKARQSKVLGLMVEANAITPAQAESAQKTDLRFRDPSFAFAAPHFAVYVRQELEKMVGPDYIYQVGLRVTTTLDPRLQAIAEEEVRAQVDALTARHVTNGALVALDAPTGQILAMVGSKDFRNEAIAGQVNMALSPRQPGSAIKPLTYLAAFEKLNWTPATLLMDVPVEYSDGAGGVYRPQNYDDKFRGPVLLRPALANSLNIPAIKTLEAVGLDALKEMAARLGITTLTRNDYGLALTLGGGEVPLLELTGVYQVMANGGVLLPPTAILQVTDSTGREILPNRPQPRQALRAEHAYLITNILADNEARAPLFGPNSPLRLSRPAAAKTGTTNDYRDNWAMGYTPDLVTGVWVGNADNTPMVTMSGVTGAGPIWHNFMEQAHEGRPVRDFTRPSTIIELEICADSGTVPSEVCPARRKEIFAQDQPPLGAEHDIHQLIEIDLNTGLRANEFCRARVEKRYYRVYPPDGWEWAISQGVEQPPRDYCPSRNIIASITSPADGATVRSVVTLEGAATAANFSAYQVEAGLGAEPAGFNVIYGPNNQLVEKGILAQFDTTQAQNGPYTLRLVVFDKSGGSTESRVRVLVDNPATPTPTNTPNPTPTLTPLPSATSTALPMPTSTDTPTTVPLATDTPTIIPPTSTTIPPPTVTATDTPTVVPTDIPTVAPTDTPPLPVEIPTDTPTIIPSVEPTATPTSP